MAEFLAGGGEMGAAIRDHDWSSAALGPMDGWPAALRVNVDNMVASAIPAFVVWGPDEILLYNDAYAPILGLRHPGALGRPFRQAWPEIWSDLEPLVRRAYGGEAIASQSIPLLMERNGAPEETWFAFFYTPLRDEGTVTGFFCGCIETTEGMLATRRQAEAEAVVRDRNAALEAEARERELAAAALQESEARFRNMADNAPLIMWVTDPTGFCTYLNPRWYEFTGQTREQAEGFGWLDATHPDDKNEAGRIFLAANERAEPFSLEYRLRAADGSYRWAVDAASPRFAADGGFMGYVGSVVDIDDRKRAEAVLTGANQALSAEVVERTTERDRMWAITRDPLAISDLTGVLLAVNPAWTEVLGWSEDELLGRTSEWLEHPDDRDKTRAETVSLGSGLSSFAFEHRLRARDGSYRTLSWSCVPEGERIYCSARDVTEERAGVEALRLRTAERDRIWERSRDMLGVADARGVWVSVSPAWTRILGWDEAEIVGRTSEWMEHPDDVAKTRSEVASLAAGQPTYTFENRFRAKDGSYVTLSWTAEPEDGLLYCVARDVTEERRHAAELRLNRDIVQSDRAPIVAFDRDLRVVGFNRAHDAAFRRVMGRRQEVGDHLVDQFPEDQREALRGLMERALAGETFSVIEEFGDPEQAEPPTWEITYSPLNDEAGDISGGFHVARDISDRVRAERERDALQEQLRQSQKMEAVGQLTGGLAHDFNNLLAGISGALELMGRRIQQGRVTELEKYMIAATGATKRAASLTHRLLAFSRRQTLQPKPTSVNALVTGMLDLVQRTVGPGVHVDAVTMSGLWTALVDAPQLENALLNLCINARDAMPDGGNLTIETANRWIDREGSKTHDLPEGQYLSLCVSDTGTGMAKEIVDKAFDPFFTTKPLGAGTGLGLSMIYGFARQSGGHARIYSEVGQGTMVCIYLPRHRGEADVDEVPERVQFGPFAQTGETVLVVDDEPTVRLLVADVLADLGYTCVEAADSAGGLRVLESDARIDLLVSDVGLPGMNGRQMVDAARIHRPDLRVLFITGFAENALLNNGQLEPGMSVLTKPFAVDVLAARIRELITAK